MYSILISLHVPKSQLYKSYPDIITYILSLADSFKHKNIYIFILNVSIYMHNYSTNILLSTVFLCWNIDPFFTKFCYL